MPFSKPVLAVAKALGMLPGPNKLFFLNQHSVTELKLCQKSIKVCFFPKNFFQGSEFFVGWKKNPKIVGNFQTFF